MKIQHNFTNFRYSILVAERSRSMKNGISMKKLLVALAFFAASAGAAAQIVDSGTCGDNLTWTLTGTSPNLTLTINGEGAMENYNDLASGPWKSYSNNITVILIGDSVTSIGHNAFQTCQITSIFIPKSVTSIWGGGFDFRYCSKLTSIDVDVNNPNFCSEDGILYDKLKTTLITHPPGKAGAATILNGVTNIGGCAFVSSMQLTSVTFPNSVTTIGSLAFFECTSLTSITIPNSVTTIEPQAFWLCPNFLGSWCSFTLTDVYVNWATPLHFSPFSDIFQDITTSGVNLHVPCGTQELYAADLFWKKFNIVFECVTISGTVMQQDLTPLSTGTVSLYKKQNEKLKFIKTVSIENDGTYSFVGVEDGDYIIRAKPNNAECAIATYYGNTELWSNATIVTVANSISVDNIDITVFPCVPLNGTGIISGYVYYDNESSSAPPRRSPGLDNGIMSDEPAEDVAVVLEKGDDIVTPVDGTTTDATGSFSFKNLLEGNYKVLIDVPGVVISETEIYLNDGEVIDSLTFVIPKPEDYNKISIIEEEKITVFPNPTTGELHINFPSSPNLESLKDIQIFDITGRLVGAYPCGRPNDNGTITINISHLPQGLYLLKINTNKGVVTKKVVKK